MNPNHYLAVAIAYLFAAPARLARRRRGRQDARVELDDRPRRRATSAGAWPRCRSASSGSSTGCSTARFGFGGEESAGASFLRRDGTVWTTDKDGILLDLLAARDHARVTGKDPGELYRELEAQLRRARLRAHRRPGDPGAEGRAREALAGRRSTADDAGRRADPRQADAAPRATTRRSAGSRSSPRTAGSPRGPRAPRTSTRSTPRASRAATTWRSIQDEARAIVAAALAG